MIEQNHHHSEPKPEPGFKTRMIQAVQRYFIPNQSSSFTALNGKQLIREHPDLLKNDKFLEQIFKTAQTIYDRTNSEK